MTRKGQLVPHVPVRQFLQTLSDERQLSGLAHHTEPPNCPVVCKTPTTYSDEPIWLYLPRSSYCSRESAGGSNILVAEARCIDRSLTVETAGQMSPMIDTRARPGAYYFCYRAQCRPEVQLSVQLPCTLVDTYWVRRTWSRNEP